MASDFFIIDPSIKFSTMLSLFNEGSGRVIPWPLGQCPDCLDLDDITNRLKDDLEQDGHMTDVDEKYLKLVIEGVRHGYQEEPMTHLITKGCFIGKLGCHTKNDRDRLDFISKI